MKIHIIVVSILSTAVLTNVTSAWGQTELSVLGGATGADVFCLQAGKVGSGAFAATFLRTPEGGWEKRTKSETRSYNEMTRNDLGVSLVDSSNATEVEFDFVSKRVRERAPGSGWADRYVILNASDEAMSKDCVSSAPPQIDAEASSDADESSAKSKASSKPSGKKAKAPSKKRKKVTKPTRKKSSKSYSKKKSSKKSKKGKDCFPIFGPDGTAYPRC